VVVVRIFQSSQVRCSIWRICSRLYARRRSSSIFRRNVLVENVFSRAYWKTVEITRTTAECSIHSFPAENSRYSRFWRRCPVATVAELTVGRWTVVKTNNVRNTIVCEPFRSAGRYFLILHGPLRFLFLTIRTVSKYRRGPYVRVLPVEFGPRRSVRLIYTVDQYDGGGWSAETSGADSHSRARARAPVKRQILCEIERSVTRSIARIFNCRHGYITRTIRCEQFALTQQWNETF